MFGLIGFGSGYIEWFLPGLLYSMPSSACVSRNVISVAAITRICVLSPDCRLNELPPLPDSPPWIGNFLVFDQAKNFIIFASAIDQGANKLGKPLREFEKSLTNIELYRT